MFVVTGKSTNPDASSSDRLLNHPPGESRIVLADDDRLSRETLAAMLERHGYQVEAFEDGQQVVERTGAGNVDLVLLDVLMPRLTGLEACRVIKGMQRDSFLPVVLVTVKSDTASRVEGLRIGADDYVCKPFDEAELLARVEAMLRIKKLHDHVNLARAKLEQLSVHDELTGLHNYRYLHFRLNEEFKRAERYHDPLACMVVDIDGLHRFNSAGGRPLGDRIIRGIAGVVRQTLREVDVVARFGGDEFLVVLPSTHFAGSVTVAERIWSEARARQYHRKGEDAVQATVSVGVALFPSRDVRTKDGLLRAADAALRQAKRDGSDRICVFQQDGYLYTPMSGEAWSDVASQEALAARRAAVRAQLEAREESEPPRSYRSSELAADGPRDVPESRRGSA